jgi:hypothetical protein
MSMTELRCPPCTGNCQQGRACPAYPSLAPALSDNERSTLERRWQIVEALVAIAAVAVIAGAVVERFL